MQSGTADVWVISCEKQHGSFHILLCYLSDQEGVSRRRDHVLQFGDRKIEAKHGKHRVFSIWGGVGE